MILVFSPSPLRFLFFSPFRSIRRIVATKKESKASSTREKQSREVVDSPEVDSSKVVDSPEVVEYDSSGSIRPKKRRKVASRIRRNHSKSVIPKGGRTLPSVQPLRLPGDGPSTDKLTLRPTAALPGCDEKRSLASPDHGDSVDRDSRTAPIEKGTVSKTVEPGADTGTSNEEIAFKPCTDSVAKELGGSKTICLDENGDEKATDEKEGNKWGAELSRKAIAFYDKNIVPIFKVPNFVEDKPKKASENVNRFIGEKDHIVSPDIRLLLKRLKILATFRDKNHIETVHSWNNERESLNVQPLTDLDTRHIIQSIRNQRGIGGTFISYMCLVFMT